MRSSAASDVYKRQTLDRVDSATYRIGQRVDLSKVWFELKGDQILEESHEELDKLAFLLSELPETVIELVIHMNYFGEEEENKELSRKTAKALYNYLRSKGVENQILYNGFGRALTPPVNGRQRDRIIEVIIRRV